MKNSFTFSTYIANSEYLNRSPIPFEVTLGNYISGVLLSAFTGVYFSALSGLYLGEIGENEDVTDSIDFTFSVYTRANLIITTTENLAAGSATPVGLLLLFSQQTSGSSLVTGMVWDRYQDEAYTTNIDSFVEPVPLNFYSGETLSDISPIALKDLVIQDI